MAPFWCFRHHKSQSKNLQRACNYKIDALFVFFLTFVYHPAVRIHFQLICKGTWESFDELRITTRVINDSLIINSNLHPLLFQVNFLHDIAKKKKHIDFFPIFWDCIFFFIRVLWCVNQGMGVFFLFFFTHKHVQNYNI